VSVFSQLLGIVAIFMFFACILYVAFGQITVRKLRKNPKTKDALGVEFASGWDIINVAQALAFPKSWSRVLEKSPLSFMNANATALFENTTKFDQILGFVFYWLLMLSGLSGALLVLLDYLGVFSE
jgi:preprotein translocase subunit SecY